MFRDFAFFTSMVAFGIWTLLFLLALSEGLRHASTDKCIRPMVRIEYIVPGYQLGCWLGEVP